jgi:hypothetical protein
MSSAQTPSGWAYKSGSFGGEIAAAATQLQYPLSSAGIERLEHDTTANDQVVRFGYRLLQCAISPVNASVFILPRRAYSTASVQRRRQRLTGLHRVAPPDYARRARSGEDTHDPR